MSTVPSIQTSSVELRSSATWGAQTDLDRIAASSSMNEQEKIGELAKEFESMLFKQVLKGMKQSFGGASMFPSEGPHAVYGDMMIESIAQSISHAGQIGFARTFTDQMTHPSIQEEGEAVIEQATSNEVKENK